MKNKDLIYMIIFVLIVFFMGAVSHESDLSRNFKKTGNASAWFFPIKCENCIKGE